MKHYTKTISWIVVLSLALSGCSVLGEKSTPTPEPNQAGSITPIISATGVVVPEQWTALSMPGQGIVAEVLVSEGEPVTAGQLLVRLNGSAAGQAEVSSSQYEITDAQQALDALTQNAPVESSQTQQALFGAQQALIEAQRGTVEYDLQAYKDDLDRARQDTADAKDRLETAQEDFDPYAGWDEANTTRKSYKDKLDEAQRKYDEALRAQQELELAHSQADAAVTAAQANLTDAQDEYDRHKNGPDPDELSLAQSRLDQANTRLAAAQETLSNLELHAPFDGVVCNLQARVGEWLTSGMPVLYLGNLGSLRVETTDLNEIDAARIGLGTPAMVTFDALPNTSVNGTVQRVAHKSAEGSGVNYTVVVNLDEIPEGLRWGMTAFVDFEVKE